MEIRTMVKASLVTIGALALSAAASWIVVGEHSVHAAGTNARAIGASAPASMAMPLGLPTEDTAKTVLDASLPHHHPQWVDVPMGSVKIHVFVVYPDLTGTAQVDVITALDRGLTDRALTIGTDLRI